MRVGQQVLTEYRQIGQDNVNKCNVPNKYNIFKSAIISLYCRFFVFKTDKYQIKNNIICGLLQVTLQVSLSMTVRD